MRESGFVMGVVTIALVAMSIAGVAILTLSTGETDLAGQVKRQQQLAQCALAGTDVAIAGLPDTTAKSFTVDPSYTTGAGHHAGTTASPAIGIVPATLTGDLPLRQAGENIVNLARPVSLGSGAAGVTRQPYRFVTTCTSNGQTAEAEKVVIYGGGR